MRVRANGTASDIEDGTFRLRNHFGRGLNLLAVCLLNGLVPLQVDLVRPDERCRTLLAVLGDVDEHGPGSAGRRDVVRSRNRRGDVPGFGHEKRVFGDGHRDTHDVHLLKSVGSHERREHLSRNRDHRDGIHVGISDSGYEVRRSRATRGDANPDLPLRKCVTLRGVARSLFVTHEDVSDCGLRHQFVIERHDGTTGEPEDISDSQNFERLQERTTARHHRRFAGLRCCGRGDHRVLLTKRRWC